jgi:hypothetical protein
LSVHCHTICNGICIIVTFKLHLRKKIRWFPKENTEYTKE